MTVLRVSKQNVLEKSTQISNLPTTSDNMALKVILNVKAAFPTTLYTFSTPIAQVYIGLTCLGWFKGGNFSSTSKTRGRSSSTHALLPMYVASMRHLTLFFFGFSFPHSSISFSVFSSYCCLSSSVITILPPLALLGACVVTSSSSPSLSLACFSASAGLLKFLNFIRSCSFHDPYNGKSTIM